MRRLSNRGSWAQLLRSMWDPPRPGLEPVSPALAGRFSTTAPPGKPSTQFFLNSAIFPRLKCHASDLRRTVYKGSDSELGWDEWNTVNLALKKVTSQASLVAQWLRIHLPMQGTWVRALGWEDPACHGATKPMCHNYWARTLEPASHNYWVRVPQLLKPTRLELLLCNKRSHHNEKPMHCNEE